MSKQAIQYYAVCNVGGPISVSIMAIDDNDATAQFESMNAREAIDDCKCDAEDELDINGQSMDEDDFESALRDAGFEFARDLDPVASAHDGRAMSVVGGWKLYRRSDEINEDLQSEMKTYVITCESGARCLVRAGSAQEANAQWDREVQLGDAEPRRAKTTREADQGDIEECVDNGHDYR